MTCSHCNTELQPGQWPWCPHDWLDPRMAQRFDPVVVFRDRATGEYVFPGSASDPTPSGCDRVEMRDIVSVRRFESEMNERYHEKMNELRAVRSERFAATEREHMARRERLRAEMSRMSAAGRAFAEAAMRINDERRSARSSSVPRDCGFYVDAFSNDASNRLSHRGRK